MKIRLITWKGPAVLFLLLTAVSMNGSQSEEKISPRLAACIAGNGEQTPVAVWVFFRDKGPDLKKKLLR